MTARSSAVIAMGSNLGDRGRHLWWAIQQLMENGIQVTRCSSLYETSAAYVTDQPSFLNAALLVTTELQPPQLLSRLKHIEQSAGRDIAGGPRWGPRPLDLDIILYGSQHYRDERLQIPHPRWRERDFVKVPMSDLHYSQDALLTGHHQPAQLESNQSPQAAQQLQKGQGQQGQGLQQVAGAHDRGLLSVLEQVAHDVQGSQQRRDHFHPSQSSAVSVDATTSSSSTPSSSSATSAHSSFSGLSPTGSQQQRHQCQQQGHLATRESMSRAAMEASAGLHQPPSGGDVTRRVMPVGREGRLITWGDRTWVMGILNVTPDSFSDGGAYLSPSGITIGGTGLDISEEGGTDSPQVDVSRVVSAAIRMVSEGAHILDVGGQSTRPGAPRLTTQQELGRVVPVIRALRSCPDLQGALISVDTFDAQVAQEAVYSGADIVNDVSGGTLDPQMLPMVAALGVPYVLMHMRGDPGTMQSKAHTSYEGGPVWQVVGQELQARADAAVTAGIPAWSIILDPGIGFAKTLDGNLDLIQNLGAMRRAVLQGAFRHAPLLVGPSRKGFLGKLTGRTIAAERDAATVAACTVCVASGAADVVRVHAVKEVADGMKVADAVWRGWRPTSAQQQ